MKGYKFEEGQDVAHKDRLTMKMVVRRILRKTVELQPPDGNPEHKLTQDNRSKMIGIECHYWKGDELKIVRFHSRELVPWNIVELGEDNVKAFLVSMSEQN